MTGLTYSTSLTQEGGRIEHLSLIQYNNLSQCNVIFASFCAIEKFKRSHARMATVLGCAASAAGGALIGLCWATITLPSIVSSASMKNSAGSSAFS